MSKISENIVDQIKKEKVTPRPRWVFVVSNIVLITMLIVTVAMGGVAMSLIYLKLFSLEWNFVTLAGDRGLPHIFEVMPLLWILLLLVLLGAAVWAFERTEGGYRYQPTLVVVAAIFMSMLLGALIYTSRGAEVFENALRNNLPPYEAMEMAKEKKFLNPEQGILVGEFLEKLSEQQISVEDISEKEWTVDLPNQLARDRRLQTLKEGQPILVIGKKTADQTFEAREIKFKRITGGSDLRNKLIRKMMQDKMPKPPLPGDVLGNVQPRLIMQTEIEETVTP